SRYTTYILFHTHLSPSHYSLFTAPTTPDIYTLSLHDALPISLAARNLSWATSGATRWTRLRRSFWSAAHLRCGLTPSSSSSTPRSEEHTSELQSRSDLVCRLLLEKKKTQPRS